MTQARDACAPTWEQAHAWNRTQAELGPATTLHQLVLDQCARTPDNPAVIAVDRDLSYAEVGAASAALATDLVIAGVRAGDLVAVWLPPGWEQVVAVLAVLRAGAVYVPLDVNAPAERAQAILARARPSVAILRDGDPTPTGCPTTLSIVRIGPRVLQRREFSLPAQPVRPTDLAYVIFTSGSTGEPKGVALDHAGPVNTIRDVNRRYQISGADRVFGISALTFDLSVWDLFGTLSAGATLVMPPPEARLEPAAWVELAKRHGVTVWNSVPAIVDLLVDELDRQGATLPSLRLTLMSGDWIPLSLPARLRRVAPASHQVSMGGATEASIWSVLYDITSIDPAWTSIPYGRPMLNQRMYVFDEYLRPSAVGETGDIYIAGIGLAQGYYNDRDRTARSFFHHPGTKERLYHTGDLGRIGADGLIEFLGRSDHQVKLRGFRVELGEIEAALLQGPDVTAATVVPVGEGNARQLVAFLVGPRVHADVRGLRADLAKRLPDYMIPARFEFRDAMPLTANGKVDRAALIADAAADVRSPGAPSATAPPPPDVRADGRDPLDAVLPVVARALSREAVIATDNFFELGGDSIVSMTVVSQLRTLGWSCLADDVFRSDSLADLARACSRIEPTPDPYAVDDAPFPMTPIHRWFAELGLRSPSHFNQSVLLETPARVDLPSLTAALELLAERHDVLRLEVGAEGNTLALGAHNGVSVRHLDLSASLDDDASRTAVLEAYQAAQQAFGAAGPKLVALLVAQRDGPGRLLLVAHHTVIDGVSWRVLISELEECYEAIVAGRTPELPDRGLSFQQWAQALAAHAQDRAFTADTDYWSGLLDRPVDVGVQADQGDRCSSRLLTWQVDSGITDGVLHRLTAAYDVQVDDALLTALLTALLEHGEHPGGGVVRLDVEGHGREPIDGEQIDRTVGWFTTIFPVVIELTGADPLAQLASVRHQFRKTPRKGQGFGVLRYLGPPEVRTRLAAAPRATVRFNYLGHYDQALGGRVFTAVDEPRGFEHGIGDLPHPVEVTAFVRRGHFEIAVEFDPSVLDVERAQRLGDLFVAKLSELVTSPALLRKASRPPVRTVGVEIDDVDLIMAIVGSHEEH